MRKIRLGQGFKSLRSQQSSIRTTQLAHRAKTFPAAADFVTESYGDGVRESSVAFARSLVHAATAAASRG